MKRKLFAALVPGLLILSPLATAQQGFFVKPLAEKKVTELPPGDLFWHLATFDAKEQAQAAAGSPRAGGRVRRQGLAVQAWSGR